MRARPSRPRVRAGRPRSATTPPVLIWLVCGAGLPALTACGSAAGGATGTVARSGGQTALKFSQCMRSHGVTNFPDPSNGAIQIGPASGIDPRSPSFQNAQRSCGRLIPGLKGGGPVPAALRGRLLAMSRCMRSHGVSNFPDPNFSGGGVSIGAKNAVIAPSSPAFQRAAHACGGPVLGKGHGLAIAIRSGAPPGGAAKNSAGAQTGG